MPQAHVQQPMEALQAPDNQTCSQQDQHSSPHTAEPAACRGRGRGRRRSASGHPGSGQGKQGCSKCRWSRGGCGRCRAPSAEAQQQVHGALAGCLLCRQANRVQQLVCAELLFSARAAMCLFGPVR